MEKEPPIENQEKPARFRTIEKKVLKVLSTGESIEEVIECNGQLHRKCVDKITYDALGVVEYADQLSRVELGVCNHNHT